MKLPLDGMLSNTFAHASTRTNNQIVTSWQREKICPNFHRERGRQNRKKNPQKVHAVEINKTMMMMMKMFFYFSSFLTPNRLLGAYSSVYKNYNSKTHSTDSLWSSNYNPWNHTQPHAHSHTCVHSLCSSFSNKTSNATFSCFFLLHSFEFELNFFSDLWIGMPKNIL